MNLKSTFKKQGGLKLIKQYIKGGAFFTAINQFIVLGRSKIALEILRLSAEFKIRKKIEKQYINKLIEFDKTYIEEEHNNSNKVWVCWFQGFENSPQIVKTCLTSLKTNLPSKEIVLITKDNLNQYVDFPKYIIEKWEKGFITNTHMTDLLRLELLIRYGGTWIDATVLCTENEKNIPDYFFNSDLFFFQTLKPGKDGQSTYISSWYINAKSNNKILEATRFLCYEYWQKNDELVNYFLLHDFISIVLDYYSAEWKNIVPRDNSTPHNLLLRLFDLYDKKMFDAIIQQSPFHKLTYKFNKNSEDLYNTNYKKVLEKFNIGK